MIETLSPLEAFKEFGKSKKLFGDTWYDLEEESYFKDLIQEIDQSDIFIFGSMQDAIAFFYISDEIYI